MIKRTLGLSVFFLMPFLLALFGNRLLLLELEDEIVSGAETRLEDALGKIEGDKDPRIYFSRFFRGIERQVFGRSGARRSFRRLAPLLKRTFPGAIELVFLDGQGNPDRALCDRHVPGILARKFIDSYRRFQAEKKPLSETAIAFMHSFMGSYVPTNLESHGTLLLASPLAESNYLYFSGPRPEGMFMAFLNGDRPLRERALAHQVRRHNRTEPGVKLCLVRRGEKAARVLDRLGLTGKVPADFWATLRRKGAGKAWFEGVLLARRSLFPGLMVFGAVVPETGRIGVLPSTRSLMLAGMIILLALAVVIPIEDSVRSVRIKLLLGFLYTALLPSLLMGLTVRTFLEERRSVLIGETHRRCEAAMMAFDSLFNRHWIALGHAIESHHQAPDYTATDSFTDFQQQFDRYRRRYDFDICRIFDSQGRLVLDYYSPELPTMFGGPILMAQAMARTAFSELEQIKGAVAFPDRAVVAGAVTNSKEMAPGFITMDPRACSITEFVMGNLPVRGINLILGNQANQFTHSAFFYWDRKKFEWNYVNRALDTYFKNQGVGECFAWAPNSPELSHPLSFRDLRLVKPLLENVVSQARSYRKIVRRGDDHLLVTGLRGHRLKFFSFLCVTSDQEIEAEIGDLAWSFRFVTVAVCGLCLIIGVFLGRLFIEPLGHLTRGIRAISERDFHFTVPILAQDEFGLLGTRLNEAMGDLQDLEVARAVQESLFPRDPLILDRWEVFGSCQPASQVGGDYFDYFALEGNRAVLVIGDVSGHGVGAALVVAMAKAVIGHPATSGQPGEILASLNAILFTVLKRRKIMSCCLGVLDQTEGILTLANSGQTYPIQVDRGRPTFLELKGYPLGSIKNWKAAIGRFGPFTREVILFYTDGLVEARDRSGAQVGYDRLLAALPGLIRGNAVATEQAIRAWHEGLTGGGSPEDDITVIVLQAGGGVGPPEQSPTWASPEARPGEGSNEWA